MKYRDILRKIVFEKLNVKEFSSTEKTIQQINYELDFFEKHNLSPYILALFEITEKLKHKDFFVNSYYTNSSIVCYCLGMSVINPFDYALLFDRLFNNNFKIENLIISTSLEAVDFVSRINKTEYFSKKSEILLKAKNCFVADDNINFINDAQRLIQKEYNISFFPSEIILSDIKTISLFKDGNTDAVLFFNSREAKELLKKIAPNNISDLALLFALNRPGANILINNFLENNKLVKKLSCLKETNGLLIYQEQFLEIIKEFSNLSVNQSIEFLVAVRKKNIEKINEFKNIFIQNLRDAKNKYILEILLKNPEYLFLKSYAIFYVINLFIATYPKIHYSEIFKNATKNHLKTII